MFSPGREAPRRRGGTDTQGHGGIRGRFIENHKLRTRKSGHVRHIDMHLVVPKQLTVEAGHELAHRITADIEKALSHSQILVHIEPCPGVCESCAVECPKLGDSIV